MLMLLLLSACQTAPPATSVTSGAGDSAQGPGEQDPEPTELVIDPDVETAAIHGVVDDWHAAAAQADQARYLKHFSADAVFMGTDGSERWTLEQFTQYVQKHFPAGGWTYRPHDRQVALSADGTLAWFDEKLANKGYGELRGTGVLRMEEGTWRIAHYSMTFTIPNGVSREVVGVIRTWKLANPFGATDG